MWKLPATATALVLSASLFVPAIAQENTEDTAQPVTGMMRMMGGNCPMMMTMGRAMMGGGMMGQGMGHGMGKGMGGGGMGGHHGKMHGGGGMGMGMGMMGGGSGRMASIVEARLAYLRSELNLTGEQEEAWKAYAETAKSRIEAMQEMRQSIMKVMGSGTALERMNARIQGIEAVLASMKQLQPATEKLYAALTDDQKNIADQLIGVGCGAI